ncbi:uncharacterized protein [Musca autumnalis]|uniref:uncharacterized protein n=1 Tax=Musca autumnalis TaxID=221902 RepID=UPI003CF30445
MHNNYTGHNLANTSTVSDNRNNNNVASSSSAVENSTVNLSLLNTTVMPHVLLATIRVIVRNEFGNFKLRAILDQGAQATLITENAAQLLRLPKYRTFTRITGVGGETLTVKNFVKFDLASHYEPGFKLRSQAYVMPSLNNYCAGPVYRQKLPSLEEFTLADPHFDNNDPIDLLIGGDLYGDVLLPQQRKFDKGVFLQLTHFGWIVSGPTAEISYAHTVNVNLCTLDTQLNAFWEQEELIESRKITPEELACEAFFKANCSRGSDGRYTVALPFKSQILGNSPPKFCHTDFCALKRLKQVNSKFVNNLSYASEYKKIMEEYESLGHMKKIGHYPNSIEPNGYFLPHHGVVRESSSTTKLRVVFDGSSKRPRYTSLNDEHFHGPALQNDLPATVNRWRRFKIGFRSDLENMFRQIRVVDNQQHYQQILWRKTYPEASNILMTDTYVDDIISGADTESEAIFLQKQLVNLLSAGGFNLRKWTSNSAELMAHIPEDFREKANIYSLNEPNVVKALGLGWNTNQDAFSFQVCFPINDRVTKASLLSDAAKLYDPLGWLAPVTIQAKIYFQKLWLEGIDWKDEVSPAMKSKWHCYLNDLKNIEQISIPRWIGSCKQCLVELHGFCDASTSAFAAAVYVKVLFSNGERVVNLLQTKTKFAPLKVLSIPKLELCGATHLAKLMNIVQNMLDLNVSNSHYWTDSVIVLCWLGVVLPSFKIHLKSPILIASITSTLNFKLDKNCITTSLEYMWDKPSTTIENGTRGLGVWV